MLKTNVQVKFDSNGNRYGMDVSFWVVEGKVVDGFSYTLGTEVARFTQDTGQVQASGGEKERLSLIGWL